MNISAPFIARPIATTLLTIGIALAGIFAYAQLPVSPLPQVDFPTISVQASLPGASPDTVATSVASPLERHLGQIADVTEMTSQSTVGAVRITLQFGLDRNIDGAARDVEAAINAARADLPTSLRQNPTYRKVNPADAPVMILALTSKTLTQGQLYDSAATVLEQKLSQMPGVGEVDVNGSALPAVRVELNPGALFHYGIGLEDVRAALASANANAPKGAIEEGDRHYQLYTNDQARRAVDYRPLVIAYRNNAAVRLSDVADIDDSVEDLRNSGLFNGQPTVVLIIFRQPGANIISTVDGIRAVLPQLEASLPGGVTVSVAIDRTPTVRASLIDTQRTLVIAILLVIGVVFVFLGSARATLIPAVAVPVSIIGTFAAMYLLGFSLDNLSLMALTISTGFVVDDAIVVLENIARHMEAGMGRMEAALLGAREVGFTVLSISASLIAVFLPILLMGGIVGRLFREFALTLSIAIVVSLVISLTATPMLCALFLRVERRDAKRGWFFRHTESAFAGMQRFYERTLAWSLDRSLMVIVVMFATIALNIYLFVIIPKGFFPQQDTGALMGTIQADQSTSFQSMRAKLTQIQTIVRHDPAVATVVGFTGGSQTNTARMFVSLKPLAQRDASADQVIAGLRPKLGRVAGARLFLQAVQDIRVGGRQSNAQYQYTLQADDAATLYHWAPILTEKLQTDKTLADVNSDQQQSGLQTNLVIDRSTAARLNLTPAVIDNTLYDAFGQRQVSTIYNPLNQYHVVMELAPRYWQSPQMLREVWISTTGAPAAGTSSSGFPAGTVHAVGTTASAASVASDSARNASSNALAASGKSSASAGASVSTSIEKMVPLAAISRFGFGHTPLGVNHQGPFVAATISFNLPPGRSLGDATAAIARATAAIDMPAAIVGTFAGTAATFQQSTSSEPMLILAALVAVYIVLGILYESAVHPITILSTLPSAGVGAVLALILTGNAFSIIALIGVILLIGIVKKNAILMIDFALTAEREQGLSTRDSIFQACLQRFRPIMMTTFAAMLGAMPLALDTGEGAELRRPLGVAIVGGLIVSQALTLYTTPIVYLYLDRFRLWSHGRVRAGIPRHQDLGATSRVSGHRSLAGLQRGRCVALGATVSVVLSGCMVGPDYHRPAAPVPNSFKELAGWKQATPRDDAPRGAWWMAFGDPVLAALEQQVEIGNQTLAADAANYRNARALIDEARANLFPSLSGNAGATRTAGSGATGFGGSTRSTYSLEGSANWTIDVWGQIRRQVESSVANAQASAALLASATLAAQALLATDYMDLRVSDALKRLLDETVRLYSESLRITQNQYDAGFAARSDVLTAQAQLDAAHSSLVSAGVARATYEHAIAVLIGQPPAALTIRPAVAGGVASVPPVPDTPVTVPSALLERRPDVAEAERTMQAENALVGVAVAAYYPAITLSALFGYSGDPLGSLISTANRVWSVGAAASDAIFQGGGRTAAVRAARATYDAGVADYRQTVLAAFQQVEDALSSLRILAQQAAIERQAVQDSPPRGTDRAQRISRRHPGLYGGGIRTEHPARGRADGAFHRGKPAHQRHCPDPGPRRRLAGNRPARQAVAATEQPVAALTLHCRRVLSDGRRPRRRRSDWPSATQQRLEVSPKRARWPPRPAPTAARRHAGGRLRPPDAKRGS